MWKFFLNLRAFFVLFDLLYLSVFYRAHMGFSDETLTLTLTLYIDYITDIYIQGTN